LPATRLTARVALFFYTRIFQEILTRTATPLADEGVSLSTTALAKGTGKIGSQLRGHGLGDIPVDVNINVPETAHQPVKPDAPQGHVIRHFGGIGDFPQIQGLPILGF
jgi:hypothetical protein